MAALEAARDVDAPDWLINAGAIRDVVFDALHDRPLTTPPRDVDLGFFDPGDLSPERDAEVEAALRQRAPDLPWEAKNQAAVHVWYPKRFGFEVPPFRNTAEAVATFPLTAACVGVRLRPMTSCSSVAPHGLVDLGLLIRVSPARHLPLGPARWLGAAGRQVPSATLPMRTYVRVNQGLGPQPLPPRPGYAQPDARARRGRRAAPGRARRRALDLPVLLDARSPLYSRAAVRWQARLCLEARGMELGEAAFVLGGLEALGGEHGEAVALALAGLLEARGLSAAARVLARWGSFALRPGRAAPEHGDT